MFSLQHEGHRSELLNFITSIYDNSKKSEKLRINFRKTEKITAEAMILFVANLERALAKTKCFSKIKIAPPINNNYRKQQRVRQVLSKVGAYNLCNQKIFCPAKDKTVIYWKKLNGSAKEPLDPKAIYEFLGKDASENTIFIAVKEALLNILHHAYTEEYINSSWWLFVQEKDGLRTVVVCDLGIGIPTSIRQAKDEVQSNIFNRITRITKRLGRVPKDSEIIKASIGYGKSGTGLSYRGKGLPAMKQVIDSINTSGAGLAIFSNEGCYVIHSASKKSERVDYSNTINGTVVTWSIPVSQSKMDDI